MIFTAHAYIAHGHSQGRGAHRGFVPWWFIVYIVFKQECYYKSAYMNSCMGESVCILVHTVVLQSVIHNFSDLNRLARMRQLERMHKLKHHFITSDWISDSIDCQFLKNERLYEPKTIYNWTVLHSMPLLVLLYICVVNWRFIYIYIYIHSMKLLLL